MHERLYDPLKIQEQILLAYKSGRAKIDEATPPWIRQALVFHRDQPWTAELSEKCMASGGTDHPDPTLRSSSWEGTIR